MKWKAFYLFTFGLQISDRVLYILYFLISTAIENETDKQNTKEEEETIRFGCWHKKREEKT